MSLNSSSENNILLWQNEFIEIEENSSCNCGIVVAKREYIPIQDFKEAFLMAKELATEKKWKSFIFDKHNLTVFHQASMEWYYTEWKNDLVKIGLTLHFKILPLESWFKASVDAGISEIKSKHPEIDFDAFEVRYVKTITEALQVIQAS